MSKEKATSLNKSILQKISTKGKDFGVNKPGFVFSYLLSA